MATSKIQTTNVSVPTFTPSSGAVSVPTNTLRIVDGVLCGNLQITTTNNMPTTQWTTVGTLSPAPTTMIQVSAFNPGNVSYFGVMAISTAGTVTLKPVVEAKSAMVMLSYHMNA